jgi:hypothetical protein
MNGALAEADVLGIFGREGLDLATMWGPPASTDAVAYAFRIYRNYDGQGSAYGETWVRSTSGDTGNTGQDSLAIYGAQRASDSALTLVVLNKTAGDLSSTVTLTGFTPSGTVQVWRYGPANLAAVVREADATPSGSTLAATFPANSITLLVVSSATVVALPDAGPADAGAPDAGLATTRGSGAVSGLTCSSAPGSLEGFSLLALLLLAFSRPRDRASRPPRSRRG